MPYTQPTFGTMITNPGEDLFNKMKAQTDKDRWAEDKRKCIASGGKWDDKTHTCSLPFSKPSEDPYKISAGGGSSKPAEDYSGYYDPEKKAFITNSGKVYPTGNPDFRPGPTDEQIEHLKNGNVKVTRAGQEWILSPAEWKTLNEGKGAITNKIQEIRAAPNLQQQRMQQLLQAAQAGLLTPEQLQSIGGSDVNVSEALGAGAVGAIPGVIGGAVGGATVGALGGPIGAVAGAVIGGLGTFLTSVRGNIKGQQTGEFAADASALSKGERYLRSLVTDTNQNPQNAAENIALFYQTLNLIDAAHAKTWKDSQEDLNVFLGNDGTPQLAKFEVFDNTMRQYYISQFNTALNAPDPNKFLLTAEDFGVDIENE